MSKLNKDTAVKKLRDKKNRKSGAKKPNANAIQTKNTSVTNRHRTKPVNVNPSKFFGMRNLLNIRSNSLSSNLTLIGLCLLLLAIVVLIWDTANGKYALTYLNGLFAGNNSKYPELAINDKTPPGPAPKNMVWIPGGKFWMGADDKDNHPVASPVHKVYVDGFWMDETEVTNAQWKKFAKETGYKTIAERRPAQAHFPNLVIPEDAEPFSLVFTPPATPVRDLSKHLQWWAGVKGASWKNPLSPEDSIRGKPNYPVVHISWIDAAVFCNWRSRKANLKEVYEFSIPDKKTNRLKSITFDEMLKLDEDTLALLKIDVPEDYLSRSGYRLPTEAEWEFAARGAMNQKKYLWGDELKPDNKYLANIWQGQFPHNNTKEDGYIHAAPVKSYPPNPYGLYDMAGNAWEWCQDWYQPEYYKDSKEVNPPGPATGFDPLEPGLPKRVQRGGSFLCHVSYCERYLTYARGKGDITSASNHVGFRCVRTAEAKKGS